MRMAPCSHGWGGLEVIEDCGMLPRVVWACCHRGRRRDATDCAGLSSLKTGACSHRVRVKVVEVEACSKARVEDGSMAGVEDNGVLKDDKWRCPMGSGRSDNGRWKCLEILSSVGRESTRPKIFRAQAPSRRRIYITRVSYLTDVRHAA
jgi:hypothetical protein